MNTAIIIPARFASSRLPGKPLLRDTGKYLVQHVYERACQAQANVVVIATDDDRIARAVREFGGQVVMTSPAHQSGTDRIAEVARGLNADVLINVQGDEPLIEPGHLNLLRDLLAAPAAANMATLAVPLAGIDEYHNPNCVKLVCDGKGRALYFSRSPIPYVRGGRPDFTPGQHLFLRHLGLYAYRRDFLLRFAASPPHPLEQLEKLEQLRAVAMGATIQVGIVEQSCPGVDTREDYRRFVREYRRRQQDQAA
jgi:3-deoxy-manno-octulosonate cytidylyltransferase (CMP-KDO synthetase)